MKHRTLDDVKRSADLYLDVPSRKPMSQYERLGRWAETLEAEPARRLGTLDQTEYCPAEMRDGMRCDESAISVAFDDPLLRAEGLRDDTYGAARRFFGLSDRQLHYVVCYCHCGATMRARDAAFRVRAVMPRFRTPGLFARFLRFIRL